ncbi:MAG: hypothetical protein ACREN8_13180 [Candidatus Dormibacteraceae bacterium]
MPENPARTLLLLSPRPHPWALLRDRLDPQLLQINWAQPEAPLPSAPPFAVIGEGEATYRLAGLPWPILGWWVGDSPSPAWLRRTKSWHTAVEVINQSLHTRLNGVGLAPTCGFSVGNRGYLKVPLGLESLLAASPGGIPYQDSDQGRANKLRSTLRKYHLPLNLTCRDSRASLG